MDPVEEAKDLFSSLSRKAKVAGKSAFKSLKKAVGIPTGTISEANPRYYIVFAGQGALVRREMSLDSPEVYNLQRGEVVTCVEIVGRRARIIDPVEGWISLTTSYDEVIMGLTIPPDKKTQVRTMNRRFDKLKQEQSIKVSGSRSPVATPMIHRTGDITPTTTKEPIESLKSKIVFKSTQPQDTSIPKISKPLRTPLTSAPVVDLLDVGSPVVIAEMTTPDLSVGSHTNGMTTPDLTLVSEENFSLI